MVKFLVSLFLASGLVMTGSALAAHAFSQYDEPKYPPGFTHFEYVNPDAPKGGDLFLANPGRSTSFDKFNPFSLRGVSAPGLGMMFESLATQSQDEVATMYGLLADDMALAPDRMSMTFRIHPEARFNNGDPVLAADVKYSFDILLSKGAPYFKSVYADIKGVTIVNERTVRFDFRSLNRELPLVAGAMPVFSRKWAEGTDFDRIQLTPPIASGPYVIDRYDVGRSMTYRLNPDYWGKDLPTRRGMYNFGRIHYRLFADDMARLEAFKAGDFDVNVEYRAKNWARAYTGAKFRNGDIEKKEFKHANGAGMQGFIMNLRRPAFQDERVRKALALALDFEWMNRQLFYNQYERIYSFFTNSEMAATGVPTQEELALLEPMRKQLNPAVFGPVPLPPSTAEPASLRGNLLQAVELLREAGWEYRDGALRNAKGEPFRFEILDDQGGMSRVISVYVRNLQKLGMQVHQRTADFALVQKRLEEYDFDMMSMRFPDVVVPGNELFDMFSSKAADQKGSSNYWGLKDPAVDKLVETLVKSESRKEMLAAARALDRVLLHKHIVVTHWFSSLHRVAYWNRFGIPDKPPLYYSADSYVIATWWQTQPRR